MKKSEAVFELFERLNKIEDEQELINAIPKDNILVKRLLYYAIHPDVVFMLPEGDPPYTPANGINTHSVMWQEIKRLEYFIQGISKVTNMQRLEHIFIQILENVHPKDAELVLNIKDRKWPFLRISPTLVNKIWPELNFVKSTEE